MELLIETFSWLLVLLFIAPFTFTFFKTVRATRKYCTTFSYEDGVKYINWSTRFHITSITYTVLIFTVIVCTTVDLISYLISIVWIVAGIFHTYTWKPSPDVLHNYKRTKLHDSLRRTDIKLELVLGVLCLILLIIKGL